MRRMMIVRPERDLVGARSHRAGNQLRLQPAGQFERVDARPIEWSERALLEGMVDAEELHRMRAQLTSHESAEVYARLGLRPCDERHQTHTDHRTHLHY